MSHASFMQALRAIALLIAAACIWFYKDLAVTFGEREIDFGLAVLTMSSVGLIRISEKGMRIIDSIRIAAFGSFAAFFYFYSDLLMLYGQRRSSLGLFVMATFWITVLFCADRFWSGRARRPETP